MESLETAACFVDDLLDFSSDIGEDDEEDDHNSSNDTNKNNEPLSSSLTLPLDSKLSNNTHHQEPTGLTIFDPDEHHHSFPEFLEEELEWLSNEDAFPAVEAFDEFLLGKLSKGPKQQSPVSVLESSGNGAIMSYCGNLRVPVRARSKGRRRRRNGYSDISGQQWWWWWEPKNKSSGGGATTTKAAKSTTTTTTTTMGRRCLHCLAEKTPQWRAGPLGPKTLCNACGVRYKSGRLVPEYRPASSPTFQSELHSNSHRKILEMRRQKHKEVLLKSMDKG
ncbi:PREDICTED: GATA transcription factor 1-like [Nelumbo nucifera]|uniref:GATA transcription factor 1-like n=1 Tax=Nelumbo nucifera TaxID=4432 RepID=A0A1U7Z0X5_NELNU|nr:PREDICTED: GATA transcription factor 1-like [Nelumbo nucifera]